MEPRDLEAAYQRYCRNLLENCHTAGVDAKVAVETFNALSLFKYKVEE